jgi:hypothetical protein
MRGTQEILYSEVRDGSISSSLLSLATDNSLDSVDHSTVDYESAF